MANYSKRQKVVGIILAIILGMMLLSGGERGYVNGLENCEERTSAVIRINLGDPYIHENSAHLNCNVASVSATANYITVTFDESMTAVYTATASSDEQLAIQGVICGVSGGVSGATIYCNKDIDEITNTNSNIWFNIEGIR